MTKTVALLPELVETVAKAIEVAVCCDGERTPGSIWASERGRQQMLVAAKAAIEATRTQTDQQLREEVERLREAAELAKACLGAGFGDHPIEAIRGSNINRAWHYLHDALHTSVPLSPIKEGSK